jgi:hypothetical protein
MVPGFRFQVSGSKFQVPDSSDVIIVHRIMLPAKECIRNLEPET